MLKFTLMKNLYYELNPDKMAGSVEKRSGDARYRTIKVSYPEISGIHSLTMQARYLTHSILYYLYVNEDPYPSEITEVSVKKLLLAFYHDHFPSYIRENVMARRKGDEDEGEGWDYSEEEWKSLNILDCLDPDKMPGYDDHYAFSEILTVEDLRNGKTGDEFKQKTAFPGMTFTKKYRPK